MIIWKIALQGKKHDLQLWEHYLPKPHLPYVEWFDSNRFDSNYLLTQHKADSFVSASAALVAADQVIATLNGIMQVRHACQQIKSCGIVMRFQDDVCIGQAAISIGQTGHILIRGGVGVCSDAGATESLEQRLLSQTLDNQPAINILKRLGNCVDWRELYRAFEAMTDSFPEKRNGLRKELNIPKKELTRFVLSCNKHRHHNAEVIKQPMDFDEAKRYLMKLAQRWMAQL